MTTRKLCLRVVGLWLVATSPMLHAQPSPEKGGAMDTHEALIVVARLDTRAPVAGAILSNRKGQTLGSTDPAGTLSLQFPVSVREELVVRADGYAVKSLQLDRADKPEARYEVFLEASVPVAQAKETIDLLSPPEAPTANEDMVKVYVWQPKDDFKAQQDPVKSTGVRFAVQLSATSRPITDKSVFGSWEVVGPVFIHQEEGLYKVRIGPYASQQEAKQTLLKVKEKGKTDAFIVVQEGREEHQKMERNPGAAPEPVQQAQQQPPVQSLPATAATEEFVVEETGEYKVRLASYLKPGGFNTQDIDQYGTLETYRQGEWTIMLIGGLKTKADAERVRDAVVAKGFKDARVVIDRDGILEDVPK